MSRPSIAAKHGILTPAEVAALLRLSTMTIRRFCDRGILSSYRLPGSAYRRITAVALQEFCLRRNLPIPTELHLYVTAYKHSHSSTAALT